MKLIKKCIVIFILALSAAAFIGCDANDVSANNPAGGGSGGGSGGGDDPSLQQTWLAIKDIEYLDASNNPLTLQWINHTDETATMGNGWGALMKNNTQHDVADFQIWNHDPSFDASFTDEYGMKLVFNSKKNWVGGAFIVNKQANNNTEGYYDMSAVKKITYKVCGSSAYKIWVGASTTANSSAPDSITHNAVNVTTEWQEKEFNITGVSPAWTMFAFACESIPGNTIDYDAVIGDGWQNLFKSQAHSAIDFQIWANTMNTSGGIFDSDGALKCVKATGQSWMGGAFVQNIETQPNKSYTYDTSRVAKVTFEAKCEKKNGQQIWAGVGNTKPGQGTQFNESLKFTLSNTAYQTFTIPKTGNIPDEAWAIFGFGGSGMKNGETIYIKNIIYYDAGGNELDIKYKR
ncbi:hypothetical protein [Treponema sp. SP13]|uniref:hypothetical protein n=1 Tax=Treponema sp. SP13 TaxID=2789742 RepID=UPI003D938D44